MQHEEERELLIKLIRELDENDILYWYALMVYYYCL